MAGVRVVGVVGVDTPLFQTNFFPDLTQVNFLPELFCVIQSFTQLLPAFGGAALPKGVRPKRIENTKSERVNLRIEVVSSMDGH